VRLLPVILLLAAELAASPLPVEWKKALVAIELPTPVAQRLAGAPPFTAIGTGFFVAPDSQAPFRALLFTADHVLSKACDTSESVYLRHESSPRTPNGEPQRYRLPICERRVVPPSDGTRPTIAVVHYWTKHPRTDLAVIPTLPRTPESPSEIVSFSRSEIATSEVLKHWSVGEADETYTISFHPNVVQTSPSSAIIRHGIIAEFSSDPDTFLIDSLAFPGDSGSPVVLRPVGIHFMNGG